MLHTEKAEKRKSCSISRKAFTINCKPGKGKVRTKSFQLTWKMIASRSGCETLLKIVFMMSRNFSLES